MTALQLEGLFFFFFAYLARVHFNKKWWLRQLLPMNIFSFWLGLPHTSTCNFVLKKIRYTHLTNESSQSWIHSLKILRTDFKMKNLEFTIFSMWIPWTTKAMECSYRNRSAVTKSHFQYIPDSVSAGLHLKAPASFSGCVLPKVACGFLKCNDWHCLKKLKR